MLKKSLLMLAASQFVLTPAMAQSDASVAAKQSRAITKVITHVRDVLDLDYGLSVALTNKSKTFFSKSFGYADFDQLKAANKNSSFYVASTTKSLIAALTLIMQQEGLVDIDTPIAAYLPESFKFFAPELSKDKITLRDLMAHKTGLSNRLLDFRTSFTGVSDTQTLLNLFARSQYAGRTPNYSNLDYILVGLVLERVSGKSWKTLINEKLLIPLNMTRTTANFDIDQFARIAKPHGLDSEGKLATRDSAQMYIRNNTLFPSGGLFSNAFDINKYQRFVLNKGCIEGKCLVSEGVIDESMNLEAAKPAPFPYDITGYGLGWEMATFNDQTIATHDGSNQAGYKSSMVVMPAKGYGISLLSNENTVAPVANTIIVKAIMSILGGESVSTAQLDQQIAQMQGQIDQRIARAKGMNVEFDWASNQPLSILGIDLDSTVGTYVHPGWGEMVVSRSGDKLHFALGNLGSEGFLSADKSFQVQLGLLVATVTLTTDENQVAAVSIREIGAKFNKMK